MLTKPNGTPRSKTDRKARADAVYDDIQVSAEQEEAPPPLTVVDIEKLMIPQSFHQYLYTMRLWNSFKERQLKQPPSERPFEDGPPSVYMIKLYLKWLARSRTGILEDNITDTTVYNRLASLKRAIRLHTNYRYSRVENEELDAYVRQDLIHSGLVSTAARPKPVAPLPVAEDLILFSWACDEYQGLHPRARVQLPLAILLMCSLGVRPGEVIESDAWKHTNEGLLYKDVALEYQDDEDYCGYLIKVRLRNRKGHRDYKKHAPVMILTEEPTMRSVCPVFYFMTSALADGVFSDVNTFDDLEARKIQPGALSYCFKYKPEALERPIMRSTNPDGSLSETRVLTYDTFNQALKGLGQRAGYEENLSAYCFRRAFARTIFKTGTAQQQKLLMNHQGDQPMGFYTSGIVGIDSQSMIRGRPQRIDLLEKHISMAGKKRLNAPQPPGSRLTDTSRALTYADDDVVDVATSSGKYGIRQQARHKAYCKKREDFFEGGGDDAVSVDAVGVSQRSPSRYLKALWKFDADREHIVKSVFRDGKIDVGTEVPLKTIIPSMVRLASPQKRRYHYQSAAPLPDNCCAVCKKKLDSKRPARLNTHLLHCARQRLKKEAREHMTRQFHSKQTCQWLDCDFRFRGKPCGSYSNHVTEHLKRMRANQCLWNNCFHETQDYKSLAYHLSEAHGVPNDWTMLTKMHYCYEHDMWCQSEQQWSQHITREHFLRMNDFCGLIRQAGVVVVAAHCLFCLGDVGLPISTRFTQFTDVFTLHKHMKEHLSQRDNPLSVCPLYPRCKDTFDSERAFWEHAESVHGTPPFGACRETDKRKTFDGDGEDLDASDASEGSAGLVRHKRLCVKQASGEGSLD